MCDKKSVCTDCGGVGAHKKPAEPPSEGMLNYDSNPLSECFLIQKVPFCICKRDLVSFLVKDSDGHIL